MLLHPGLEFFHLFLAHNARGIAMIICCTERCRSIGAHVSDKNGGICLNGIMPAEMDLLINRAAYAGSEVFKHILATLLGFVHNGQQGMAIGVLHANVAPSLVEPIRNQAIDKHLLVAML